MALVPPAVVTVTSTCDGPENEPVGGKALIRVELTTVKMLAIFVPNLIVVAPVKLVPVMATVGPFNGPDFGDTVVTVGAAT